MTVLKLRKLKINFAQNFTRNFLELTEFILAFIGVTSGTYKLDLAVR